MHKYDADWFEGVLDAMHDMVLVKGPRSRLLWANKAFRDLYGMSVEDLHGIVDAKHSDPDDTLQYVIDDQTVFESARDLDIPVEVVTDPNGRQHYFHTVKSPIIDAGEVVRTVGVSRRAIDEAVASRVIDHHDAKAFIAPLGAFTQCFPTPMLMLDVAGRVLKTNPVWNRTFGDPGRSPDITFEQAYGAMTALSEQVETCLCTRSAANIAIQVSGDTGKKRHLSVNLSPWTFADGALGGVMIVATDVTELFQQTEALRQANDELVQFSYRASHDLKGPLSTMKGLAHFIVEDIRDGDIGEAVESARQIVETAHRLEQTVISILDLARADLKSNPVESFDLSDMVDEISDGLTVFLVETDVRIIKDLNVRQISSQPVRVRQIVENLISNGIKYRAEERQDRFVRVTTEHSSDMVRISVADNGMGIAEAERHRVFDLFARFNTKQEGAGLGLSIVDKHVKALGGSIEVTSGDSGTDFTVLLPNLQSDRLAS